jgi:uncharacterized protein
MLNTQTEIPNGSFSLFPKTQSHQSGVNNNSITLILKITHNCNLQCKYCYYQRLQNSELPTILGTSSIASILEAAAYQWKKIRVIFHGGEPLLMKMSYFKEIIDIQRIIAQKFSTEFENSIQTNGTIYSKKISNFLQQNGVSVGISLDGFENTHNANRKFAITNQDSFERVVQNLDSFRADGLRISAIVVATRNVIRSPDNIYHFFKSRNISFKINELVATHQQPYILPSQEEMASFLCRIFDLWFNDRVLPIIRIKPLSSILASFWTGKITDCTYQSNCTKYLSVETDGSIYVCGRFNHLSEFKLGNALVNAWPKMLSTPLTKDFHNRCCHLPKECQNCVWLTRCWGGCTANAFMKEKSLFAKTPWCYSRRLVFSHILDVLTTTFGGEKNEPRK